MTLLIFPEFKSWMSCLGWYWGRTGEAIWLASKIPDDVEILTSSNGFEMTSPKPSKINQWLTVNLPVLSIK